MSGLCPAWSGPPTATSSLVGDRRSDGARVAFGVEHLTDVVRLECRGRRRDKRQSTGPDPLSCAIIVLDLRRQLRVRHRDRQHGTERHPHTRPTARGADDGDLHDIRAPLLRQGLPVLQHRVCGRVTRQVGADLGDEGLHDHSRNSRRLHFRYRGRGSDFTLGPIVCEVDPPCAFRIQVIQA